MSATSFISIPYSLLSQVLRLEGEYELEPMLFTIQTAIDENRSYLDAIRNERYNPSIGN